MQIEVPLGKCAERCGPYYPNASLRVSCRVLSLAEHGLDYSSLLPRGGTFSKDLFLLSGQSLTGNIFTQRIRERILWFRSRHNITAVYALLSLAIPSITGNGVNIVNLTLNIAIYCYKPVLFYKR